MAAARRRRPRRPRDDVLRRLGFAWLATAALVAALAGCGSGKKQATVYAPLKIYFLRHGVVQPVLRTVPYKGDLRASALAELADGPTTLERKDLGLDSSVQKIEGVRFSDSVAHVPTYDRASLAQIVYTLTEFPSVRAVLVGGTRYTRKDFEAETPIILVESPLPFAQVTSPLHATGTANTFEATFQYDLRDPAGKLLKTHFVTATSGTGTRGTFDFSVPFATSNSGLGKLVVYELSAKDGSRIHQVEIPVDFS